MKIRYCIRSMRLRTIPLSLAGIVLGVFIAASKYGLEWLTVVSLILTTVSLQILSNLSNELGDTLHGTDSAQDRQGMHYSLMDGALTVSDIKKLIAGAAVASIVFGSVMIYSAFGSFFNLNSLFFIIAGIAAIMAAMRYTLGKNPYGYRGLGDAAVYIFFGIATVAGGNYICCGTLDSWSILLPASAIGFFSVGVLNVNNIRDMKSDYATRTTVAIKLGEYGSRIYQTALIASGWLAMVIYTIMSGNKCSWLYTATLPLFVFHLYGVWTRTGNALDKMLPLLVISSFLFSILAGIGIM